MSEKYVYTWLKFWDDYTDQERWHAILSNSELFSIRIDNDSIIVMLKEDLEKEEPLYYQMDKYGYHALMELLQSQKIDTELV